MTKLADQLLTVTSAVDVAQDFLEHAQKLLDGLLQSSGFTTTYYPNNLPKTVVVPAVYQDSKNTFQLANNLEMLRQALAIVSQVKEDTHEVWQDQKYTKKGWLICLNLNLKRPLS